MLLLLALQVAEIPFEVISRRDLDGKGPLEKVIRDAKAWKEFWGSSPVPKVDFTAEAGVVVVDRQRPSSGYSIEITKIVRERDAVIVSFKRSAPPKGTGQLAVITEPSCVVRAKLPPDLPVRFVEEKP